MLYLGTGRRSLRLTTTEATRHITSGPETGGVRVLVVTTFDGDEYVVTGVVLLVAAGFDAIVRRLERTTATLATASTASLGR